MNLPKVSVNECKIKLLLDFHLSQINIMESLIFIAIGCGDYIYWCADFRKNNIYIKHATCISMPNDERNFKKILNHMVK